jgi:hypothetical protein
VSNIDARVCNFAGLHAKEIGEYKLNPNEEMASDMELSCNC